MMTRKMLWYACLGLLCCGAVAFVVNAAAIDSERTVFEKKQMSNLSSRDIYEQLKLEKAPEAETEPAPLMGVTNGSTADFDAELTGVNFEENEAESAQAAYQLWLQQGTASEQEKELIEQYIFMPEQERDRDPLDDRGGPDTMGYGFVDNLCDTATFAWIELCGDPSASDGPTGDDSQDTLTWGWNFPFYGVNYTSVHASTNGLMQFVTANTSFGNLCPYATATPANPQIAPYWDDQYCQTSGGCTNNGVPPWIRYRDFGTHFVVEWSQVPHFSNTADRYSYEVILYPDGKIKFQYNTNWNDATTPNSASIGIDAPGAGRGVEYRCNTAGSARITGGRAIWFATGLSRWAHDFSANSVTSPSGPVAPGASVTVTAVFQNRGSTTESSPVKYQFNGGAIVTEATAVLAPNATESHTFATTFTAPAGVGVYPLQIWSDLATDSNHCNDTLNVVVRVWACPDFTLTAPGSVSGNTCGAYSDCPVRASEEQVVQVTIPTTGQWTFSLCSSSPSWNSFMYLTSTCCTGTLTSNDDGCGPVDGLSTINCRQTTAGTYYVIVEGDLAANCGAWTLNVTSCLPCTAIVACQGGDIIETAEVCDSSNAANDPNGGCNNDDAGGINSFGAINCGETICGRGFTFVRQGANNRDTDWYLFTLTEPETVRVTVQSEFTTLIGVVDTNNCVSPAFIVSLTSIPACSIRSVTSPCLPAGTYAVFVAPSVFTGVPCNREYRVTLTCGPCPDGRCCYGDPEAPTCDNINQVECTALNGSWNGTLTCDTPCPVCVVDFTLNAPGSLGPISTCGAGDNCTLRAGQDYSIRLVIPATGQWNIAFCMPDNQAWDSYAYLTSQCCGGTTIATNDDGCADNSDGFDDPLFPCLQLAAGTYYLDYEPFSSAVCSLMTLNVTQCVPCSVTCQGGDINEVAEQCDSTNAASDPDGGCNNTGVDTWGAIDCGQTICGNLFTYIGPGGGQFRDTDWYHVTVADSESLYVHVESEIPSLFGIVNDDNCVAPVFLVSGTTTATQCTSSVWSQCLPPGTYTIFVAPTVFTGFPCPPRQYRVTLQCIPCGTDCEEPENLTVYRAPALADSVNLRWLATQTIGFYTVYGTTVKNNDGDPDHGADANWTLLATIPAPGAPGDLTYTHSPLVSYMNYVVEHDCTPRGRCCYGDPGNPSCLSPATQAECDALTGGWTAGLNCTDNPCPICIVDFTLTAPGSVSGNTTGAGDDCALRTGADQNIAVNIPAAGNWTFSICDPDAADNWDSYMYVTTACCGGTTLDSDDDTCPEFGVGLSEITCLAIPAPGVYYVDIEPFSSTGTGPWTLTVTQCP